MSVGVVEWKFLNEVCRAARASARSGKLVTLSGILSAKESEAEDEAGDGSSTHSAATTWAMLTDTKAE